MSDQSTKNAVFLVAIMASLLTPFMASSINVALPAIQSEFNVDAMLLTWIPTTYLLSCCIFLIPIGKLADLAGRKLIFVIGISIFTLSSFLCAVSFGIWMFLMLRVCQGLGTSMIFGTSMAMLATVFPPGERGKVIGINVAVVYIGLSSGPFLGGLITEYFSWRGIFLSTVPLGMITIFFSLKKLNWVWRYTGSEKFDMIGSGLYGLSTFAFMVGLSNLPDLIGAALIVLGCFLFYVFAKYELNSSSPIINLELFKTNKGFAFSGLAAMINYSATFAVTFLLSLYLQYIKGLSPKEAGLILMVQPITMVIVSPLSGRVADFVEPRKLASTGMFITAVGLFSLTFVSQYTDISTIIEILVLLGLGFGLFSSPNMTAIMNSVQKSEYGFASGVVGSMRIFGQMLSMGLAQLIFAVFIGPVHLNEDMFPVFIESLKIAFLMYGLICVAGIYPSVARGNIITRTN